MVIGKSTKEEIVRLYDRFFEKAGGHLTGDGIMILYSHDRELVHRGVAKYNYTIKEEWEISYKEGTYVFVISIKDVL